MLQLVMVMVVVVVVRYQQVGRHLPLPHSVCRLVAIIAIVINGLFCFGKQDAFNFA
jgi:hypothetical protein